MASFVLYCKSYAGDLLRVQQLWHSIERYNLDRIPFFVSVPQADRSLFEEKLGHPTGLTWVSDEDIILANPRATLDDYRAWNGQLSQQVVKSEFWRYAGCDSYLCLDSECQFIRDFHLYDFLDTEGHPYTVMYQSKELNQLALNKGIDWVAESFHRDCAMLKDAFERVGPDYEFGPPPMIWSAKVWSDLDEKYLQPRGMTLWDAVRERPSELRWYGEALLRYRSIPLTPIEPLFRFYHYNWQWHTQRRLGETEAKLKREYLGVVYQSNWQYQLDYGDQAKRKSWSSRLLRSIKAFLARFR